LSIVVSIEEQLGLPMPTEEENKRMPEEIGSASCRVGRSSVSSVYCSVTKQRQRQQQAQQQQQDPVLQMQMQELQLKMKKMELDEKKLAADAAAKADQLEIERERLQFKSVLLVCRLGQRSKVKNVVCQLNSRQKAFVWVLTSLRLNQATKIGLSSSNRLRSNGPKNSKLPACGVRQAPHRAINFLTTGRAADFADYRHLCGVIRGLTHAESIVKDLVQRLEHEDD
jgi:hypothetical protein